MLRGESATGADLSRSRFIKGKSCPRLKEEASTHAVNLLPHLPKLDIVDCLDAILKLEWTFYPGLG
jgi:hypothetical protein